MTTHKQVRSTEEALSVKQPCCVEDTLKLALEALESCYSTGDYDEYQFYDDDLTIPAIAAIKAALEAHKALAQPEQPKVRTGDCLLTGVCASEGHKIQPKEPQRKPLTDEQRIKIVKDNTVQGYHGDYFDAWGIIDDVEAAHGITKE